jgi:hypothetical protein
MIQLNPEYESKKFNVTCGHHLIVVEAKNEREAIDEARRRLSVELPRLWDVISSMEESRFVAQVVEK